MASLVASPDDVGLSSLGRKFLVGTTLGLGIGIGVGAGLLIVKTFRRKRRVEDEKIVVCLQDLKQEIRELRSVIVRLKDNIAVPAREAKLTGNEYGSNSLREVASVRTISDDEEEFFEMPPDEEILFTQADQLQTSAPLDDIKPIIQEVELLSNDETNKNNIDKVNSLLEKAVNKENDMWSEMGKHYTQAKEYPENAELLWRLGKSYYDVASEKGKAGFLEEKKNLLYKGLGIVQKSVRINSQNPSAQKWCAILLGSTSEYENTQDKILLGFKYKEHITKAIELNNKDASSYHLLGRWCYEVSQLPWWQRRAAAAFIAEPPTSTVEEALENFLKAEELDPGFWLSNSYWIAKCYYDLSQYSQSKEWLQKVVVMKTKSEEDEKCLASGRELLQSL